MATPTLVTWTRGDTRALWEVTIVDPANGNAAVDLAGFTVRLYVRPLGGGATLTPLLGTIQSPTTGGKVRFDCRFIAAGSDSLYLGQIELVDGLTEKQRSEDFYIAVKPAVS